MTSEIGKKIKSILKIISYGVLSLIGIFALYMAYATWEVSEIKQLCREVTPGTPIAEMKSLISKNGGHWYIKTASVKAENEKNMWFEMVCASSTMCEARCKIYHNGIEVIEATHGVRQASSQSNKLANTNYKDMESLEKKQLNNFPTIGVDKKKPVTVNPVITRKPGEAIFIGKNAYISFWQTNFLSGNQGSCTAEFMFDSNALASSIEELTFKIHLISNQGKKLGSGSFQLEESIGGSSADRYKTAVFNGIRIKNPKEGGDISPLCLDDVTLVFDEAIGMQDGNKVDLIRNNQLRYTTRKSVKVRVK